MQQGTDAILWESVQKGDHRSYEIIFVKYFPSLRDHALQYCGQYEEAEEIAADVLHQLWVKREQITLHTGLKGYLFIAARNASFNLLRKKILVVEELTDAHASHSFSTHEGPESRLLMRDVEQSFVLAMERLPRRQGEIFRLCKLHDYSVPETAALLGITEGTVQVQLHKAVRKLKERFSHQRQWQPRKNLSL